MKKWWLKLYTFPGIFLVLRAMAVPFLINLVCAYFFPSIMVLAQLTFLYPLMFIFYGQKPNFSQNLDFHKISIPYQELRMAYGLDVIIQSLSYLVMFYCSIKIPSWISEDTNITNLLDIFDGTFSYNLLLSLVIFSAFMIFNLGFAIRKSAQKDALGTNVRFLIIAGILMVLMYIISANELGLSGYGIVFVFILSSIFAQMINLFYWGFGKTSRLGVESRNMVGIFLGFIFTLSLFMAFSQMAKNEILNSDLGIEERYMTFSMWSSHAPILPPDVVKGFLKVGKFDSQKIFEAADKKIYQLPVQSIIPERNFEHYYFYLLNGHVSKENLVYITSEMSRPLYGDEYVHVGYYEYVRSKLVVMHTPAKELPHKVVRVKLNMPRNKVREVAGEVKDGP